MSFLVYLEICHGRHAYILHKASVMFVDRGTMKAFWQNTLSANRNWSVLLSLLMFACTGSPRSAVNIAQLAATSSSATPSSPGIVQLNHVAGNDAPTNLTAVGSDLYFVAGNGTGNKVFHYDNPGETQISNLNAGGDDAPNYLVALGSKLFFSAHDASGFYK